MRTESLDAHELRSSLLNMCMIFKDECIMETPRVIAK